MTILDSSVVSALMNDPPEANVVAWLDGQSRGSVWTTAVTILEIESGLQMMPAGKRQRALSELFQRTLDRMEHRILPFDEQAARMAATLMGVRKRTGTLVELRDTMIAGIVLAHHATLATRNVSHFSDIAASVVNPWAA